MGIISDAVLAFRRSNTPRPCFDKSDLSRDTYMYTQLDLGLSPFCGGGCCPDHITQKDVNIHISMGWWVIAHHRAHMRLIIIRSPNWP